MGKIGFIFSGQGSQYVGMGKELYDYSEVVRDTYKEANEVLGFSIEDLCFNGPAERLNDTEYTQVAMVTMSVSIYRLLESLGLKGHITAGLSLGEYSALVAAGAIDFKEAIELVRKRGIFMSSAVPKGVGTMSAILGLNKEDVEEVVKQASIKGIVEIANLNCPKQIVISGEKDAVLYASELALEKGAKRAMELTVSGPFHSSLLKGASEKLGEELEKLRLNTIKTPVISNFTGEYFKCDEIKKNLKLQVMNSVLWEDTMRLMIQDGVDTFIEIGPKNTLCSFIKKIDRSLNIYNVEDLKSLDKLREGLNL